jgi:hypothetical protein
VTEPWVHRIIAAIWILWGADHLGLFDFMKFVAKRESRFAYWWFRRVTFDSRIGWILNSHRRRRFLLGVLQDYEPIAKDIIVRDRDMEGNLYVETFEVKLVELSEKDLRLRQKFLGSRGSDEDSRRGRSSRGRSRDDDIQIQRVRQYNMEKSIEDWNFVYPRTFWDKDAGVRKPHPQAGEPLPLNRDSIENLGGATSEQINDAIDEINEPPNELPEVRDSETGEKLEDAVHSPTEESFAAR